MTKRVFVGLFSALALTLAMASSAYAVAVPTTTVNNTTAQNVIVAQSVSFSATVTPAGAPGTIEFRDTANGNALVASVPNAAGAQSVSVNATPANNLGVGTHTIVARFASANTANFTNSNSGPTTVTVNVSLRPTNTTVTSSPNPSIFSHGVIFTATVRDTTTGAQVGAGSAGSVQFFDGATPLGSPVAITPADNGVVTLSTSTLSVGTHAITAKYSGNAAVYATSTSPIYNQVVRRIPTKLVASSTFTTFEKEATVRIRARLTRTDTDAPLAGRTITFRRPNGRLICTDTTNANGVAFCDTVEVNVTNNPIRGFTARFAQTTNFRGAVDSAQAAQPFNGSFFNGNG